MRLIPDLLLPCSVSTYYSVRIWWPVSLPIGFFHPLFSCAACLCFGSSCSHCVLFSADLETQFRSVEPAYLVHSPAVTRCYFPLLQKLSPAAAPSVCFWVSPWVLFYCDLRTLTSSSSVCLFVVQLRGVAPRCLSH